MSNPDSFMSLLDTHQHLDETLIGHQIALMASRLEEALPLWRAFAEGLLAHAEDEEREMLPVYAERVPIPQGGTVELFLAEHNKMRLFLREIGDKLAALAQAAPDRRAILHILERQYELKRLMEHHDMRERNFLYPLLDQHTTAQERKSILAACRCN